MSRTLKPVRVALLGYGYVGKTFHAPLIQAVDGLELSLVGSSRPEAVHERIPGVRVAAVADAAIDADVDLVVIATPNDSHFPLAAAALRAGKHVVIDKPFTITLQEAEDLAAIAQEHGRLLSVFHNRRWDSEILATEQVLQSGVLGEVTHFECHMDRYRPNVRQRWREDPGPGAGLWFDLGPHMIDQALHLFGMPLSVQGSLATLRRGGQTDDWGHAILFYPHMRVVLHASLLVSGGGPRTQMHGTLGSWAKFGADTQEPQLQRGMSPLDPEFGIDPDEGVFYEGASGAQTRTPSPRGCQQRFYEGMRDAITSGGPLPIGTQEAVAVMKVLEGFYVSAREGRVVEFA
ncbi:putative dehydrogenase [Terriglobus roseus DSM 18391]|uniref:Putative dehydrogenase n=1 Tax=Terriglobus roseus (strain DSM 18391 / NRRL B-41598 / KBS 63) TaxID=926566 RepID=I3ZIM2_TERRK|nr:oxidoreductase [Terriglobus roseus]AFL89090.1 putative dehydrogenase [Terriglobus roseus DSM 18391]